MARNTVKKWLKAGGDVVPKYSRQKAQGKLTEFAEVLKQAHRKDGHRPKPARVSSTCLVAVARDGYSVPCEWAGHLVSTRLYPNRVVIACDQEIVASHSRTAGAGQTT